MSRQITCKKCNTICCKCTGCYSPDGKHCPTCYKQITENATNEVPAVFQLPIIERNDKPHRLQALVFCG